MKLVATEKEEEKKKKEKKSQNKAREKRKNKFTKETRNQVQRISSVAFGNWMDFIITIFFFLNKKGCFFFFFFFFSGIHFDLGEGGGGVLGMEMMRLGTCTVCILYMVGWREWAPMYNVHTHSPVPCMYCTVQYIHINNYLYMYV